MMYDLFFYTYLFIAYTLVYTYNLLSEIFLFIYSILHFIYTFMFMDSKEFRKLHKVHFT